MYIFIFFWEVVFSVIIGYIFGIGVLNKNDLSIEKLFICLNMYMIGIVGYS